MSCEFAEGEELEAQEAGAKNVLIPMSLFIMDTFVLQSPSLKMQTSLRVTLTLI